MRLKTAVPLVRVGDRVAAYLPLRGREEPATVIGIRRDGTIFVIPDALPNTRLVCGDWRRLASAGEGRREMTPAEQKAELCRVWHVLFQEGDVAELRILKAGEYKKTISGYFNNPEALIAAVKGWDGKAPGVYITLNPVNPALLSRSVNRVTIGAEQTTADADVTRRRWILADFDAERPAGISSTDAEHDAALCRARACCELLNRAHGIASVLADSGNGAHVLLPVDLPNDADSLALVKGVLAALASRFNDAVIHVDQSVSNAARICKLYGTQARKGDPTQERPHRYARLLDVPEKLPPVSVKTLRAIAGTVPEPIKPKPDRAQSAQYGEAFDVVAFLSRHGLRVDRENDKEGWHHWILAECPFNPDHTAPDAMIAQYGNGALTFKCLHNSCSGYGWKELREKLEPGREYQPETAARRSQPVGQAAVIAGSALPAVLASVPVRSTQTVAWPEPLAEEAYHGLAGEIVRTLEPHTESDNAALLAQLLIGFGNLIGRSAYYTVEADRHYTNLYGVIVAQLSQGRKGTSWGHVLRLLKAAAFYRAANEDGEVEEGAADEAAWAEDRVKSGLSSGEGIIWCVRDAIFKQQPQRDKQTKAITGYESVMEDAGETDKRLLIVQTEFSGVLDVLSREGNTLSAVLRDAWDRGQLSTLTKNSPAKATNAHISLIGHITRDELRRKLTDNDQSNGFANRFLWIAAKRSKLLPDGGGLSEDELIRLARKLADAVKFASKVEAMRRDEAARVLWHEVYADLTRDNPGLVGGVTQRASPQCLRLACLYALLDHSFTIRMEHLTAALAVWQYAEQSAAYIFGDALGDPVADDILRALRKGRQGMTRSQIRDLFSGHTRSERIGQALELLAQRQLARSERRESDGGRPSEVWFAIGEENTIQ